MAAEGTSGNNGLKSGTAGGILLTILMNIHQEDVLRTAETAAIGAVVSFSISLLLKVIIKRLKR